MKRLTHSILMGLAGLAAIGACTTAVTASAYTQPLSHYLQWNIDDRFFGNAKAFSLGPFQDAPTSVALKFDFVTKFTGDFGAGGSMGRGSAADRNARWCIVDATGHQITPMGYIAVQVFPNHLAAVGNIPYGSRSCQWVVIDGTGRPIMPGAFDVVQPLFDGTVAVGTIGADPSQPRNSIWKIVDPTGKTLRTGLNSNDIYRLTHS